jgi:hypothetical protein
VVPSFHKVLDGRSATRVLRAAADADGERPIFTEEYTVLEVPILGDEPIYDTSYDDFDTDLADGPIFHINPVDLGDGLVFDSYSATLAADPSSMRIHLSTPSTTL